VGFGVRVGCTNICGERFAVDSYLAAVAEELKTDVPGLETFRQALAFLQPGAPAVGCGEHHPIEGARRENYKSATDRRVELLFFDPGEEPELACHPGPGKCIPESCQLYNPKLYAMQHIWFARWDREQVNRDTAARMIVTGPDLAAGTEVTFEVIQDGFGPIGSVVATAQTGRAEAVWDAWYYLPGVVNRGNLPTGSAFPVVTFSFVARAGTRTQRSNGRVVYGDYLNLVLEIRLEQVASPLMSRPYTLRSPWGDMAGTTSEKGRIYVPGIPPGGVVLIMDGRVISSV